MPMEECWSQLPKPDYARINQATRTSVHRNDLRLRVNHFFGPVMMKEMLAGISQHCVNEPV